MGLSLGLVEIPVDHEPSEGSIERLAARRFGGFSLIEWLVRRISDCETVDRWAILVPDQFIAHSIQRLAPSDIPVITPAGDDACSRIVAAANALNAEAVVRVNLDQPFVDPELVDRLSATGRAQPRVDYVGYSSQLGFSLAILGRVGLFADWFRTSALERAHRARPKSADRQDVTRYMLGRAPISNGVASDDRFFGSRRFTFRARCRN